MEIRKSIKGVCHKTSCFYDAYTKEYLDLNSLITKDELESDININNIRKPGIYICNNASKDNGYPTNEAGVLEVIATQMNSDYCIQRYSLKNSNKVYERHISETIPEWTRTLYKYSSGTAIPTGGSDGDIYDQYFD